MKLDWPTLTLCTVITTLAVMPFFYIGEDRAVGCCGGEMPITHDAWMHLNQMQSFARGLAAGRIYPRWDEETDKGYGAPTTCFYPPGVYYLTSLGFAVTRNWIRTWMLSYWLMSFAAACALYVYARRHLPRTAAWLAMTAYTIAPYHLLNQYQRGAQSEQLSFVWMPLCLLFAEKLMEQRERRHAALGLAASYGAFLWSHPPTAYQFTLVVGVCLLIRIVQLRRWRALLWIGIALVGGVCLAAAYFLPATVEQHLIHADDVNKTWPYHQTYVFDYVQKAFDHNDWFFARVDWLWFATTALLALLGGILACGSAAVMCGKALPFRQDDLSLTGLRPQRHWGRSPFTKNDGSRKGKAFPHITAAEPPNQLRLAFWLGCGALAAFLMTRLSLPVGQFIPRIEIGVFAWRMLGITSFALALLIGACWQGKGLRKTVAGGVFIALMVISYRNVVWPMVRGEAFVPNPQHFNFATLPATAPREAPERPPIQTTAGTAQVITWQPEYRVVEINSPQPASVQWRIFDYPGWTLMLDGRAVPHQRGDYGEIVLHVPPGQHQLIAEFRSTPIRRASNWLSVSAMLGWLILFFFYRGRSSYGTVGKAF